MTLTYVEFVSNRLFPVCNANLHGEANQVLTASELKFGFKLYLEYVLDGGLYQKMFEILKKVDPAYSKQEFTAVMNYLTDSFLKTPTLGVSFEEFWKDADEYIDPTTVFFLGLPSNLEDDLRLLPDIFAGLLIMYKMSSDLDPRNNYGQILKISAQSVVGQMFSALVTEYMCQTRDMIIKLGIQNSLHEFEKLPKVTTLFIRVNLGKTNLADLLLNSGQAKTRVLSVELVSELKKGQTYVAGHSTQAYISVKSDLRVVDVLTYFAARVPTSLRSVGLKNGIVTIPNGGLGVMLLRKEISKLYT